MSRSIVAWVIAGLHTLVLAAYVMPAGFVPERPRYWSIAYARPLFHQDWRLFAPEPPACSCALACAEGGDEKRGVVLQRATNGLCRYALQGRVTDDGLEVPRDLLAAISHVHGVGPACACFVTRQCPMDSVSIRSRLLDLR